MIRRGFVNTAAFTRDYLAQIYHIRYNFVMNETGIILAKIKQRRKELHLTQAQVAQRAGMKQVNYSRMESGKVLPGLETFVSVLKALEMTIDLAPEKAFTTYHVMFMDTPVADVLLRNDRKEIRFIKWLPDGPFQPFSGEKLDLERFYTFLKSRCYEDGRADLPSILRKAHFRNNNPYDWVRLTHGAVYDDFFWIRINDEECSYEEVRLR